MNKILMNNKDIVVHNLNQEFILEGNVDIQLFNEEINKVIIEIKDNSEVKINDFRIIEKAKMMFEIIIHNNASLTYNHSFINKKNYEVNTFIKYKGVNSKVNVNIHGVNDGGISNIRIDGEVHQKLNNELLENIRIININNGQAAATPNMMIANKESYANHNVTIGKINPDEMNYLMSKGISYDKVKNLIMNGFLINVIDDSLFRIKIKETLTRR